MRMVAVDKVHKLAEGKKESSLRILTYSYGYLISKSGRAVFIGKGENEALENLLNVDLVVMPFQSQITYASTAITVDDLKIKGGHLMWITKKGIKVRTVSDEVGTRPWSLKVKE